MANAANMSFSGSGPTDSGQVWANNDSGADGQALDGSISFTGDNATATVAVGYIDGVKTLSFTPSAIFVTRSGGAGTSTISALSATAITNAGFTLTASTTLTAATYGFAIRIIR